MNINSAEDRA